LLFCQVTLSFVFMPIISATKPFCLFCCYVVFEQISDDVDDDDDDDDKLVFLDRSMSCHRQYRIENIIAGLDEAIHYITSGAM